MHSPVGLLLMQIPLVPLLLVRSPRMVMLDLSGVSGVAASVLTAATLWLTLRQQF